MCFLMQGTPFIYQGQEIGMTNCRFDSMDEFNDVWTKNLYRELKQQGMPEHVITSYSIHYTKLYDHGSTES